jgi:hypothetical protein
MSTTIDTERLEKLDTMVLDHGSHSSLAAGACAMELVSWLAHEPWSDRPTCACPVLSAFMRSWNDGIKDDETRTRLLRPLLPRFVGSRSTPEVQDKRVWLATDWLIRVCTPAFLELSSSLREHAVALSDLPPVTSRKAATAAQPTINAARNAARDAARDAAWDAAMTTACAAARNAARDAACAAVWDAAMTTARDAARDAARDVACAAVWDAARNAARNAAWDAARDVACAAARNAARDAARDAAWAALRQTVERLQLSAVALVERMLDIETKEEEKS